MDGGVIPPENGSRKKSIKEKNKEVNVFDGFISEILEEYLDVKPDQFDKSRSRAKRHLQRLLKTYQCDDLKTAIENYRLECEVAKTDYTYRRGIGNFFGKDRDFESYLPGAYEPPVVSDPNDNLVPSDEALDQLERKGLL
jgi:hypothetical protein